MPRARGGWDRTRHACTIVLLLLIAFAPAAYAGENDDIYNAFSQPPKPAVPAEQQPSATQFHVDVQPQQQQRESPWAPFVPLLEQTAKKVINHLSGRDLQVLSTRDVVVLVDKSGSMNTRDCPPPHVLSRFVFGGGDQPPLLTRWQWCEAQLSGLSREASGALPGGIRLVLFDTKQMVYDHVGLNQIEEVFQRIKPEGGTHEAEAVQAQLDNYFYNRQLTNGAARPIVIAVITDGLPNSPSALKRVLIDASRKVIGPDEIAVTFLQIGNDKHGVTLVHDLTDNLLKYGGVYPIVHCKDFDEVSNEGLGRALVDAINESGRLVQPAEH